MSAWFSSILFWLLALPAVAAVLCLILPQRLSRFIALLASIAGCMFAAKLYLTFDSGIDRGFQMALASPWLESFRIEFALAIDGISLPLVVLTKLMMPIAILASWSEQRRIRAFMASFLVLDFAMIGTFLATDIFLFYVFWELMLVPMLLLIGVWGSTERIYAAVKFFLYTFAGSLLMLVAIFWMFTSFHEQYGFYTANILSLQEVSFSPQPVIWGLGTEHLIFLAFAIAFAIKVPLFPFHTWLPDAHVQAPTGGSVLLAAVLLKMGTYGFLRFCIPLAPNAFEYFQKPIIVLSVIGILYGAWVAFQQTDMKKLVAYSSVSHLGFVLLGICSATTEGLSGAMLQMVNHGLSTGALFLLVGVLYDRRHTRELSEFGGIATQMPWYAFFLVFVACSSMGVPGLNGFVGEFLILLGSFQYSLVWTALAALGIFFGAVYLLRMLGQVLFGPLSNEKNKSLQDLNFREWAAMIPMAILIVWLGIRPNSFTDKYSAAIENYWAKEKTAISNSKPIPKNPLLRSQLTEEQSEARL